MTHRIRILFVLPLLSLLPLMGACGKQAGPARLTMIMNAASNLNPDSSGQPLSVVVRVYQLKDKGRLESADFNAIWRTDRETLSDDLLDRQERVVSPGAQESMEIRANPMASYLGVVALFRSPTGDSWRRIIPISGQTQSITVTLRDQMVEVAAGAR